MTEPVVHRLGIYLSPGWPLDQVTARLEQLRPPQCSYTLNSCLWGISRHARRWGLLGAMIYPETVAIGTAIGHRSWAAPTTEFAIENIRALLARTDFPFQGRLIVVGRTQDQAAFTGLRCELMTLNGFVERLPCLLAMA